MKTGERLIVDDDPRDLRIAEEVTRYLRKDLGIISATSADEALDRLREKRFTDVVTDGLFGRCIEIIRLAGAQEPPIPVIVWTNDTRLESLVNEAVNQGFPVKFVDKARGNITGIAHSVLE